MLRSPARSSLLAVGLALAGAGALEAQRPQPPADVVSHTISLGSREASLEFDLASGATRTIALREGAVLIDGRSVGRYAPGGALDRAWRQLLGDGSSLDTRAMLLAARAWDTSSLAGAEADEGHAILAALRDLSSAVPATAAPPAAGVAPAAPEAPAAALEAPPEPEPAPEAPAAGPSAVQQLFGDVRNVVAVFIALAMIGFGTAFFGRRYLEVVADTASNAFGRSLVVGLLGQLLLLPTFAMMIVGLALTIVGILLLPFAIVAYAIAACAAALGGYLAVAHAIGETVTRRRMANGAFVRNPNAYGYVFTGLVGLLGLWAAAALFGWAGPVVFVFKAAAVIVTWIAATVGFGAVLLSRGGLRDAFAGRHAGDLSDEYLYATPPATPAAPRPGRRP